MAGVFITGPLTDFTIRSSEIYLFVYDQTCIGLHCQGELGIMWSEDLHRPDFFSELYKAIEGAAEFLCIDPFLDAVELDLDEYRS